ncbi:hypothetical protein HYC85_000187 [Camellia sinensis]|uniref:Uncharacterized protein n=1 Tax=Camellia sinensis TaxID=4442 RepID=A0A7J7I4D1_CAMSI|nr:hypothetical protein HYC85_000187 [Camellia sinensis]
MASMVSIKKLIIHKLPSMTRSIHNLNIKSSRFEHRQLLILSPPLPITASNLSPPIDILILSGCIRTLPPSQIELRNVSL